MSSLTCILTVVPSLVAFPDRVSIAEPYREILRHPTKLVQFELVSVSESSKESRCIILNL
jgi:hypothetical protein